MPDAWVDDEFIAYVAGLVYGDHELDTDGPTFRETFPDFDTERWSPFDELTRIARVRRNDRTVMLMEFEKPMSHSLAAVSILGWRPVRIAGSQEIVATEVHADSREGAYLRPHAREFGVEKLVVLTIDESFLRIDIEDWLDYMLGPLVDDIEVRVIAVGRYDGSWYGIMGGENVDSIPKTGVYNLTTNEFELNPPEELAEFAVRLVEITVE